MTASLNPFSDLSKLGQNQTEGSETVSECASGALPTAIGSSHLLSVPANGSPEPSPATAPNPFNLKSMYLSQARAVTIKPVLTIVPVRRANRHTYFRTHPDPAYRTDGCIGLFKIQDGSDDNVYICSPEIAFELGDEVKSYMLYTAITSLKTVFIWPLQMPDADDRWHEAHSSTMDGLEASMHTWLKLVYVGADGRNRASLYPFWATTGRNIPSNSQFIFGMAAWFRSLIKPPVGHGIAYIDWKSQEVGIGAALSGDQKMMRDYLTGDPYLAFGVQAKLVPTTATKDSHEEIRERLKSCILGTNYGLGAPGLSIRIGQQPAYAKELQRLHRQAYPVFWAWSDANIDEAMLTGSISTVFGWRQQVVDRPDKKPNKRQPWKDQGANPRALMNFPMQANGAEMLRIACCLGTERGVEIVAPVHDAVMICAPLDQLEEHIAIMRDTMREASAAVLNGFELLTDVVIVRYPDRYMDKRGTEMWATALRHLDRVERKLASA